jgi:hypothetical protein
MQRKSPPMERALSSSGGRSRSNAIGTPIKIIRVLKTSTTRERHSWEVLEQARHSVAEQLLKQNSLPFGELFCFCGADETSRFRQTESGRPPASRINFSTKSRLFIFLTSRSNARASALVSNFFVKTSFHGRLPLVDLVQP